MKLYDLPVSRHWDTGDWHEVFYGPESRQDVLWCGDVPARPYDWVPAHVDVLSVAAFDATSNAGPDDAHSGSEQDMVALLRLTNRRWVVVSAGNDYTGWGCQGDYVSWRVAGTRRDAVINGMTAEQRRRLGFVIKQDYPSAGGR